MTFETFGLLLLVGIVFVTVSWSVTLFLTGMGIGSLSWMAPALIAVDLALVTLPLIAVTLTVFDTTQLGYWNADVPTLDEADPRRLTTAAGAVLSAALIAGLLGGPLVRRHRTMGALFTFVLASVAAITFYPVVPSMLHQHLGEAAVCVGHCEPVVNSDDVLSGVKAVPFFALAVLVEPIAIFVLAVGVYIWAGAVRSLVGSVDE